MPRRDPRTSVHKVPDEMANRDLLVAVADLHNHPRNPRRGDVDGIASSLERFGQVRPIIATRDGTIVAGNHTYRAALQLGWTHIAALQLDLSPDEAAAYLIADNRWSDVATNDDHALIEILSELRDSGSLEGVGYLPDDIADLQRRLDALDEPPAPAPDSTIAKGSALDVIDTSLADPKHQLEHGQVMRVGRHYLIVAGIFREHDLWRPFLEGHAERVFLPYPHPMAPLSARAAEDVLVMVQPDAYLAGHLCDKYASVMGAETVRPFS